MPTIWILVFLLMGAAVWVSADQAPAGKAAAPVVPPATAGMALGIVKSVTQADPQKGVKPEIVITNKIGYKWQFVVGNVTGLYDASGHPITVEKIKTGEKVVVSYFLNDQKAKEARVVKILP